MKHIYKILVTVMVFLLLLTGCTTGNTGNNKLNIVVTVYPIYDWVQNITRGNDNVTVTMLLDNGVDLHSYKPTAQDILDIASSNLFVYIGGESDEWTGSVFAGRTVHALALMDCIQSRLLEEEMKEGMQSEEHEEDSDEEEMDEHIWLSLQNAKILVQSLCDSICEIDKDNESLYRDNTAAYITKLDALDAEYAGKLNGKDNKTVVFADRFPFAYLFHDYGLDYYAAFKGCSAETEASFETIAFLINKVKETGADKVAILETCDGQIAKTINDNIKDREIGTAVLNSLQSNVKPGNDYLSLMKDNLNTLIDILGD